MGLEDRDYFWEDRKRREEKFKSDTYYRPKEFRRRKGQRQPDDWNHPQLKRHWLILISFMMGAVVSLLFTMASLHFNPQWISIPYRYTGLIIQAIGG